MYPGSLFRKDVGRERGKGEGIEQRGEKQSRDWICELNQAWIPECDWAHMVEGEKHTHIRTHGVGGGIFF